MMRLALFAALISLAAGPAHAALKAMQIVEKEVVTRNADGEETVTRAKAEKVTPGETVVYTIKYENEAAEPASNIVLVMPVPKEVSYVEGSVTGDNASVSFSADGGKTYVARGRLTVIEDGETRAARGDEITHIKWTLAAAVPPKGAGEVAYKAVLR
ncbi:MAG: hypothetical protein R3C60_10635 [Parvularculaceae bacterium]